MSSKAIFGRYYPAVSAIHKLDPRTKLLCAFALGILTFVANSYTGLLLIGVFVFAIFLSAKIPVTQALRSIAPLSFIIVLTVTFNLFFVNGGEIYAEFGPFTISEKGLHLAIFLGIRLTLLMLTGCLLTLTTTAFDIASALEHLLAPLARIGFPAHEFSFVFSLSLSNVADLAQEFKIVRSAQIARGINLPTSPYKRSLIKISSLLVPLIAGVFRHADTLSCAMEARCYHGGFDRTRLHPLKFGENDKVAVITVLSLIIAIIFLNYNPF